MGFVGERIQNMDGSREVGFGDATMGLCIISVSSIRIELCSSIIHSTHPSPHPNNIIDGQVDRIEDVLRRFVH